MTVGELFVNLGVKGDDKALKATEGVRKGMEGVASSGLAAKAAILAAMYGLEHLMSTSAQAGIGLTNFSATTGLSGQRLQEWQYAAQQAGITGDEFTGSLKSVQNAMTNMLLGKGAPEGYGLVAMKVGLDPSRIKDTYYVLSKLQEFAKTVPPNIAASVIKSFGVSDGVLAGMQRQVFNQDNFAKAPKYSEGEIKTLDKVGVAWANLGQKIQMAIGHFTAGHGMQIVGDISKLVPQVLELANAFAKLADQMKVFKVIGKVFEGWSLIFGGLTKGTQELGKDLAMTPDQQETEVENETKNAWRATKTFAKALFIPEGPGSGIPRTPITSDMVSPKVAGGHPALGGAAQISIQQTLQFQHEGKDAKKTAESTSKAVQNAARQIPAASWGS